MAGNWIKSEQSELDYNINEKNCGKYTTKDKIWDGEKEKIGEENEEKDKKKRA